MTDDEAKRCGSALAKYAEDNAAWWDKIPDYEARTLRKFWQAAWAAATAPRPATEGTIPVRIPVVVRDDGQFVAVRHSTMPEDRVEGYAVDCIACPDHRFRVSWIVGNVPLPDAPVDVEGRVEG